MNDIMDLRIQKTYLGLHNAFTALLEEKRFEDFTVNELCDRAMIRRATFYKHFADKYEYYAYYMKEIVATFQERLGPDIMEENVGVYLLHMSRELIRFMKQHERLVDNINKSSMFPILLSILLNQISFDVTQVLLRSKQDSVEKKNIESVAAFYAGGLTNVLFQHIKKGIPIDEEQFVKLFSRYLLTEEL